MYKLVVVRCRSRALTACGKLDVQEKPVRFAIQGSLCVVLWCYWSGESCSFTPPTYTPRDVTAVKTDTAFSVTGRGNLTNCNHLVIENSCIQDFILAFKMYL